MQSIASKTGKNIKLSYHEKEPLTGAQGDMMPNRWKLYHKYKKLPIIQARQEYRKISNCRMGIFTTASKWQERTISLLRPRLAIAMQSMCPSSAR
jgi:hypothetical protein